MPQPTESICVYQLRVVPCNVSPLIWLEAGDLVNFVEKIVQLAVDGGEKD